VGHMNFFVGYPPIAETRGIDVNPHGWLLRPTRAASR